MITGDISVNLLSLRPTGYVGEAHLSRHALGAAFRPTGDPPGSGTVGPGLSGRWYPDG